jgi:hypothetical protein
MDRISIHIISIVSHLKRNNQNFIISIIRYGCFNQLHTRSFYEAGGLFPLITKHLTPSQLPVLPFNSALGISKHMSRKYLSPPSSHHNNWVNNQWQQKFSSPTINTVHQYDLRSQEAIMITDGPCGTIVVSCIGKAKAIGRSL